MPYNLVADGTVFTQRNFVPNFLREKCNFSLKTAGLLIFEPPLGVLWATYTVHFSLIGNRVVDFLLRFFELFFAKCYGWGATSEKRLKIGVFQRNCISLAQNLHC